MRYLMKNKKVKYVKTDQLKQKTVMLKLSNNPQAAPYLLSEAIKAIQQFLAKNRENEAIDILEQLCKQLRKDKSLNIELLKVYITYRQLDKAQALVHVLLKRFSRDSDVLVAIASFHHTMNDPAEALSTLKKARLLNPKNSDIYILLATTYQGIGDEGNAIKCLDHILDRDPKNAFAISAKARVVKADASEEFRTGTLELAKSAKPGSREQIYLYFALAWLYESIDTDTHFEHLNTANTLAKETRPWDRKFAQSRHDINLSLFNKSTVDALSRYGDSDFQPVFIAAMPRSGTTLLEQMLGAHSSTTSVGENVPFDIAVNRALLKGNPVAQRLANSTGLELGKISNFSEAILDIANEYKTAPLVSGANEKIIIDKSIVNYSMAGIIHLAFPNARIIHLQRHPLDIIYSCYQQYFETGSNYIFDLRSAAQSYKIYASTMAHWKTLFPDNIHTIRYEELIDNPEAVLRPLLEFCKLPWEEKCLNYRDSMDSINTASSEQVRMPLYKNSIAKWKTVEGHLAAASDELGEYLAY